MRPLTRPSTPYTNKEILDRVEEHFFKENHKQCKKGDNSCIYGKLSDEADGCAVGCLLTLEDAQRIDKQYEKISILRLTSALPEVYQTYFRSDQLDMLIYLQTKHDWSDNEVCHQSLRRTIDELRSNPDYLL